MPELVMIITLDFFTEALREDLDDKLEDHHLGGGDFLWKQYQDAEHFKLGQLKTRGLINIVTIMLKHKTPSMFTLA